MLPPATQANKDGPNRPKGGSKHKRLHFAPYMSMKRESNKNENPADYLGSPKQSLKTIMLCPLFLLLICIICKTFFCKIVLGIRANLYHIYVKLLEIMMIILQ